LACRQRATSVVKAVLDSYCLGWVTKLRYSCKYCRLHQSRVVNVNSVNLGVDGRDNPGNLA